VTERPDGRRRRRTLRTFLFGGMVGGAIAVAAPRLRRGLRPGDEEQRVLGLEAFEGAPCWHYDRGEDPAASGTTAEP
jgi:hypothetical protein